MNEKELNEIKARCEAATDDEWFCEPEIYVPGSQLPGGDPPYGEPAAVKGKHGWIAQYVLSTADAEFIAHARTDVPALVAEVERLRAALEPFAAFADDVEWLEQESFKAGASSYRLISVRKSSGETISLTAKNFRAAKDALGGEK